MSVLSVCIQYTALFNRRACELVRCIASAYSCRCVCVCVCETSVFQHTHFLWGDIQSQQKTKYLVAFIVQPSKKGAQSVARRRGTHKTYKFHFNHSPYISSAVLRHFQLYNCNYFSCVIYSSIFLFGFRCIFDLSKISANYFHLGHFTNRILRFEWNKKKKKEKASKNDKRNDRST